MLRESRATPRDSSGIERPSLVINVPRVGRGEANAIVGVSPLGALLRPQVQLTHGRWFIPGRREVVISERLAARLAGMQIGQSFTTGPATLTIVGLFDAGRSAFDSEIWMDANEARTIFDRENYSSVLLRPASSEAKRIVAQLENDNDLNCELPEVEYYEEQTGAVKLIKILGSLFADVHRRSLLGDEHHVCSGRGSHARDRNAARSWIQEEEHPPWLSSRRSSASAYRRSARMSLLACLQRLECRNPKL